jgi:hypothetical protein
VTHYKPLNVPFDGEWAHLFLLFSLVWITKASSLAAQPIADPQSIINQKIDSCIDKMIS